MDRSPIGDDAVLLVLPGEPPSPAKNTEMASECPEFTLGSATPGAAPPVVPTRRAGVQEASFGDQRLAAGLSHRAFRSRCGYCVLSLSDRIRHRASMPKLAKDGVAPRIEPRLHAPIDDRPWFDTELGVPQSPAHGSMVIDLASILTTLGAELSLKFLTDASVWFINPADDQQQVSFPDLILLRPDAEIPRATAAEAVFVGEVVSTSDRRKEIRDIRFQLALCEYNEVPEFALFFPEIDDPRALIYHRLVDGLYREVVIAPGAEVESGAVPGLAFRVLPREAWRPGRKVEVLFRGELRLPLAGERARAEEERAKAEAERSTAEAATAYAATLKTELTAAQAREAELLARLRAAGLDSES